MEIYVIWGFLGSGKTTLINYLLLHQMKYKKVVVLENESGAESVDGTVLQSQQFNVVDMKAGCICCTLRLKLVDQLEEIRRQYQPDIVLLEPSGLASLEDLLQIPNLSLQGTISLLDVTQYEWLMKLNSAFYKRQFYLSSLLFLTKTDLLCDEKLEVITTELLKIHPELKIVNDYRKLDQETWNNLLGVPCSHRILPFFEQNSIPQFAVQTIDLDLSLDISFFETDFLRLNKIFGNRIVRAKGLLFIEGSWYRFDAVGDSVSCNVVQEVKLNRKSFLTIWWNKKDEVTPIEWISVFLNAREITCTVSNLTIRDQEVFNYMGYKEEPKSTIYNFVQTLKQEALSICHPRLGFRFLTGCKKGKDYLEVGGSLFHSGVRITKALQKADFYVTMLSTVGEELNQWIAEKRNSNDVMAAYIADILGSVMAEAVVEYGRSLLEQKMQSYGVGVSNAYSPGYCDWNLSQQRIFFSMLPSAFCGITLTESCLMLPLKSVSSLIAVGKDIVKQPYGCAICRKEDCIKRKNQQ